MGKAEGIVVGGTIEGFAVGAGTNSKVHCEFREQTWFEQEAEGLQHWELSVHPNLGSEPVPVLVVKH